jgi:hypothetical protein
MEPSGHHVRAVAALRRLIAMVVFGLAVWLQCSVAMHAGMPSPFLLMAPFASIDPGVSGLVGAVPPPAADGKPCWRR